MKKLMLTVFAACAAAAGFAQWVADESAQTLTDGNFNFKYTLKNGSSSPKTIELKKPTNKPASPQVLDTRTIETDTGLRLVAMTDGFSDKNIAELWFADTIENLQYFNCTSATNNLVLPSALKYIYAQNFKKAKFTGTMVIPSKVTAIEDYSFEELKITGVDLSQADSLVSIGVYAFKNCNNLTNQTLVLPKNLKTIAAQAFMSVVRFDSDKNLLSYFSGDALKIPASVVSIGANAFCNNNFKSFDFSEATNLVSVGAEAFGYSASYQQKQTRNYGPLEGDVDMRPTKVATMPSGLFKMGNLVRSLELPDTVTAITGNMFNEGTVRLTNVVLSASLQTVCDSPFSGWANKATRGTTAIYWRNCPATIGAKLFGGSPEGNSITNYLPTKYRAEWKAYAESVGPNVLTLPADDNSTVGFWTSERKMAVVWYKAKYPGVPLVLIVK